MPAAGDVDKMKVVELRAELVKLGLDTKGNKPVLIARLKDALANGASTEVKNEQEDAKLERGDGEPTEAPETMEEALKQINMEPDHAEEPDPIDQDRIDEMITENNDDKDVGHKAPESLTLKPTSELMPTEPSEEAQEWQRKYEEAKKSREQRAGSSNGNQG